MGGKSRSKAKKAKINLDADTKDFQEEKVNCDEDENKNLAIDGGNQALDGRDEDGQFVRWNDADSTKLSIEVFDRTLAFEQNPNSGHMSSTVWDAGIVLAKYIENERISLINKRCLEFGSGLGIGGLCLAYGGASEVTVTDVEEANSLLGRNIQINTGIDELGRHACPVLVRTHLWGSDVTESGLNPPYDIIIASDCVFSHEPSAQLIQSIRSCVSKKSIVYIATEVRDEEVYERFYNNMKEIFNVKKAPRKKLSSYVGATIPEQLEILICKPRNNLFK